MKFTWWLKNGKSEIDDGRNAIMEAMEKKERVTEKILAALERPVERRVQSIPIDFADRRQTA